MDRPRILRLLRIGWSAGWVIVCLLLVALWVRSYWRWDAIGVQKSASNFGGFGADVGNLYVGWNPDVSAFMTGERWEFRTYPTGLSRRSSGYLGFSYTCPSLLGTTLSLPIWFPILLTAGIAAVPYGQWRFSLRTLLIVTTLVAVVLGVIVWVR